MNDENPPNNKDWFLSEMIIQSEAIEGQDIQVIHAIYLFQTGMKIASHFNNLKGGKNNEL